MRLLLLICVLALVTGEGCIARRAKVFYINSYHKGYSSSDDVMAGIEERLATESVNLEIFFMDSKRRNDAGKIADAAKQALQRIEQWQPDVIIASDDNAVKYIVAPNFKDGPIPCVFCGVNWSCEQYGLPTTNVTGMLEVLPMEASIRTLKQHYPDVKKLTVLSENTTSERNNTKLLDPVYKAAGLEPSYELVDDFAAWKTAFLYANETADLIYLPTNGAIRNFDEVEAKAFVVKNISKPVFTCDDFMMPYAVFGLTKVAKEQGQWAAETSLRILVGEQPADISVTKNSQTIAYVNMTLADRIGFEPDPVLLKVCRRVK
jgi:ABC-type uncharacterized transport system substrate-binding protein